MSPKSLKNAEDLEAAFLAWHQELFRYVYARTRQKQVAEDIVQDVFTKAWEKRSTFNPKKAALRTWLFTITVNTMRDYFRAQKRRGTESLKEEIAGTIDIEKETNTKVVVEYVFVHLRRLSQREQELLILRYVDELSIQEVCAVMGLKTSAAKVAIHRAIAKLRHFCNEES